MGCWSRFKAIVPRAPKKGEYVEPEELKYVRGTSSLPEGYNIFGFKVWAYSHPRVQAIMLGFVLFMTVGMYNVITFLGGAGQQTQWLSDIANIALYTVFTTFCFIAPACLNYFGLQWTLCFGGFGYAAYAASLWCYNHTGNVPFVIFGGCWCGLSAAFLWCAEGTAITAYASEEKKGLYVSIFWTIFQSGVVIGAAIPVGQNWNAGVNNGSRVNDGTYIGLFALMLFGAFLGLCLYPWYFIVREDGTRVLLLQDQKTFKEEMISSYQVCKRNWWIIFFCPMCWAVNYYVVCIILNRWYHSWNSDAQQIYQNNDFNGVYFTVRGRALNTFLSGAVQLFAPWILNLFTDKLPFKRRKRAFWAGVYVFVAFNALWIGGYFIMKKTKYGLDEEQRIDVYDDGYGIACFVFVMYGFMDATYNCYCYWFMGALSNNTDELSVYASLYRLLNAACQIAGYSLDLSGYSKEFMFGTAWAFVAAGPICCLPIIKWWMKDTNMEDRVDTIDGIETPAQVIITDTKFPAQSEHSSGDGDVSTVVPLKS
ncbi:UNC93-like protein [Pseudocercospora fuligena]|uniref:UNC93-like protein n=1 Tax=Pseudocercospora fuligena TaxID=685502 RepID=A0A8H6REQ7_9PEZI|nr:UNC93-like protein [Pseudocercospora fuligena]